MEKTVDGLTLIQYVNLHAKPFNECVHFEKEYLEYIERIKKEFKDA